MLVESWHLYGTEILLFKEPWNGFLEEVGEFMLLKHSHACARSWRHLDALGGGFSRIKVQSVSVVGADLGRRELDNRCSR